MGGPYSPTVTVVIPTYNRANLLGRSISSVLGQTYGDFELIIVDDGSTDNTAEIAASFDDERVKYIGLEQNGGVGAARNTGITAAIGKFVAFNDHDDEWLPDKLERQMKVFEIVPSQVGVVYCDLWDIRNGKKELYRSPHIMPEDGMVFRRALDLNVHLGFVIFPQTAVVRRECFEIAGMFDENMPLIGDPEFFIRVSKHYCLYHMSVPLMNRFITPGSLSLSESYWPAAAKELEILVTKHWQDIGVDSRLKSKYFADLCLYSYHAGRKRTACQYFIRALVASPSEGLVFLTKYLTITVKRMARAVAKSPRLLYRMAIRAKPKP